MPKMLGVTVQNLVPQGFGHPCCRSYPSWAAEPMRLTRFDTPNSRSFLFASTFAFLFIVDSYFLFGTMLYISTSSQWRQDDTEWGIPLKETVVRILVVSIIFW
jgi:hypothetical protein